MIILQAKFIGDNLYGSVPFSKYCVYNLRLEVHGSSFSTGSYFSTGNYHHIGPITIQTNSGKFPDYSRKQFDYERIESFLSDWNIVKINLINFDLPKYDLRKVKSLLFENMRQHKLDQLI